MDLTQYHAQYFAHELTKRCSSDNLEKLAGAVAGAQVDLNPHQVDAALFAFSSPLSRGALLADEVGLGKTIEAGLVLSQRWAERKRRVLVIVPSNLRKQWYQELTEKFFLPCLILETRSYNEAVKRGNFGPFQPDDKVVICSYHFARNAAAFPLYNQPLILRARGKATIPTLIKMLTHFKIDFSVLHDIDPPKTTGGTRRNGAFTVNTTIVEAVAEARRDGRKVVHRGSCPNFELQHGMDLPDKDKPFASWKTIRDNAPAMRMASYRHPLC